MWRLMLVTFGFLGWGFYELSGGADYAPGAGSLQAEAFTVFATPAPVTVVEAPDDAPEAQVTRAAFDPGALPRVNVTLPSIAAPAGLEPNFEKARDLTQPAQPQRIAVAPAPAPQKDLRQITGTVVNMRMGPGTRYDVVTKLRAGTDVEVLSDNGEGWLKLRVADTGRIGWMADFLVTAAAD